MQESKETIEQKEEKLIDIKGTLKQFVEADEPELSQEEAIMKYEEPKDKKNKNYNNYNNNDDDDMDTTEEEEHLKRIKQELLASLKRVEKLEELLFKTRRPSLRTSCTAASPAALWSSLRTGTGPAIPSSSGRATRPCERACSPTSTTFWWSRTSPASPAATPGDWWSWRICGTPGCGSSPSATGSTFPMTTTG